MIRFVLAFLLCLLSPFANANQVNWVLLHSNLNQKQAILFVEEVKKTSDFYKIDQRVILALIKTESTFNPRAIGCNANDPCVGLMQIKPKLHSRKGRYKNLPFTNPKRNIDTGVLMVKQELVKCKGDYDCALQNYNRSPTKKKYAKKILTSAKKVPLI